MTARAPSFATGLTGAGGLVLVVLAGLTLTAVDARAKPLPITQPSWAKAAIPAPYSKVPSRKKQDHRLPAGAAGWAASAEPAASANIASPPLPPLPVRKPATPQQADAAHKDVHTPLGRFEVSETGGTGGGDDAPEPEPGPPAEQPPVSQPPQQPREAQPLATPSDATTGKQYCNSIANAAADARIAWQKQELLQTEQRVEKRIAELNVKIAEYQKWMARRDEFSRKAQAQMVAIYTKMKPDAAAQQLAILDDEMAAALLTKLTPKAASAVMNEMDPKRAARLSSIIAGAAEGPGKLPPPPPSKDKGT